jgi:hypothetical protein
MGRGKETPYRYQRGTNAHLDAILGEDEVVYIVNQEKGRRPVVANSPSEALENYDRIYRPKPIDESADESTERLAG